MSNKGIFTALSGAIAQSQRLDTIANNIANVNTDGFKRDQQVFNEYLTVNEKTPDVIQVPKVPASIESFYDMQGGDKSYVNSAGTFTDFQQGTVKATGNNFDFALEGNGFFEVLTPQGVRFTRNGSFKIDNQGRLTTKQGFPVLSEGVGQPAESRIINLGDKNTTVSYTGDIYSQGQSVGKLSLVDFKNREALQKVGSSQYKLKNNYNENPVASEGVQVHQGFIEGSNVNIIAEMTDMISATRAFETNQESMKAFDSMNDKLVNVVPKT